MKKLLLLLLVLFLINLVDAQIAIKSFEANPEKILPGNKVQLIITLENLGDKDIEDVLVKLDLSQLPFAPLQSSTEKLIDKIDEDDQVTIYFNLISLANAESQIYKIPIKISYDNISKDSLISLEVSAQAKLDLILGDSEVVKVNDNGKVTLKFINNGLTQIRFLKVTLKESPAYEILSTNSLYIGEVDIDDFETEEFTIIPRIKNPQLTFELNYRDANNNEFTETKAVTLNVYTEEEAKQLGLVQSSFTGLWLILIIVIGFGIIIYRKVKRKKHVS